MLRYISEERSCGEMSPLSFTPPSPSLASSSVQQNAVVASPSIGVNLRVTGYCSQGGRKYMEDFFSVAYHESENAQDLEYAFVGIYDGHGGSEAATFAKEHLMMEIINQKLFWSDQDQDVLRAIREGYIATHYAMWREQEKWPKTTTGLPSTAGTTATVAFIRHEKIYIGHVGDSGIVLGYQNSDESFWRAKQLTQDHKPESAEEKARIINSGGKVVVKSGVPRVVWNRPRTGHKGPVRRSTPIDEIPFLAVARSLGDLWSYNSVLNEFVVSPDPDVKVIKINPKTFRCLIFGTDGLWNVISAGEAVDTVREKDVCNERIARMRCESISWWNPSKGLVEKALKKWSSKKMRADNTSVVTVILYPPGAKATEEYFPKHSMNTFDEMQSSDGYVHLSSPCHQQKYFPSSLYEPKFQMYDTDSFNQSNHIPHYDTIVPSSAMRLHLQQPPHHEGYMNGYLGKNENNYINNYETNCDNNGHVYYEDHANNSYLNSFAESYNSLLTLNRERESNRRSYATSNYNESVKNYPSEYHSYHSLHHTGLAGHDRVQHHFPNNEHQMEQRLYQEQCMSEEEGYSLTKLETRGEQQLRGSNTGQSNSYCEQAFQIFGGESSGATETINNQYNSFFTNYQNADNISDNSNSNFLITYEDDARCYESTMDIIANIEETPLTSSKTTTLCIERLDSFEIERLMSEQTELSSCLKSSAQEKDYLEIVVKEYKKDETIQINEISSSAADEPASPPEPPQPQKNEHKKTQKKQFEQSAISEIVIDSTPMKKPSIPKLVLYPNVPNENHRAQRRSAIIQKHPKNVEKRMLRSMTVDYSKRTLRSRNSLSKDMKAKSAACTNLRRSTIVQSKFIKTLNSSANAENANVINRKSLNLRSRQVLGSAIWSTTESTSMTVSSATLTSSSSSNSSQRHLRKSKSISFCDSSGSSKVTINGSERSSSSDLLLGMVAVKISSVSSQFNHLQQQMSMSFAKRTNVRNSGWSSAKPTIQTRNRVQKRLSR